MTYDPWYKDTVTNAVVCQMKAPAHLKETVADYSTVKTVFDTNKYKVRVNNNNNNNNKKNNNTLTINNYISYNSNYCNNKKLKMKMVNFKPLSLSVTYVVFLKLFVER